MHAYDVWNGRGSFPAAEASTLRKKGGVLTTAAAMAAPGAALISVMIWKNRLRAARTGPDGPRI